MGKDAHKLIIKRDKREGSISKLYRLAAGSSLFCLSQGSEKLPETCIGASQETARLASLYSEQFYLLPAAYSMVEIQVAAAPPIKKANKQTNKTKQNTNKQNKQTKKEPVKASEVSQTLNSVGFGNRTADVFNDCLLSPFLQMQDPNQNRIGQWLDVRPKQGIADLSFQLATELSLGTYTINVVNPKVSSTFKVEEHVLQKFDVFFEGPVQIYASDKTFPLRVCGSDQGVSVTMENVFDLGVSAVGAETNELGLLRSSPEGEIL
ncbi:Alpha-2-macroglobulin-like protein 1 [Aix galericulata]|nr:Alpha-2-macroglobulin-like protein 1 [Aix galericulata]